MLAQSGGIDLSTRLPGKNSVGPGWPGCHLIAKFIFDVLNSFIETSANRASWHKQAVPA